MCLIFLVFLVGLGAATRLCGDLETTSVVVGRRISDASSTFRISASSRHSGHGRAVIPSSSSIVRTIASHWVADLACAILECARFLCAIAFTALSAFTSTDTIRCFACAFRFEDVVGYWRQGRQQQDTWSVSSGVAAGYNGIQTSNAVHSNRSAYADCVANDDHGAYRLKANANATSGVAEADANVYWLEANANATSAVAETDANGEHDTSQSNAND